MNISRSMIFFVTVISAVVGLFVFSSSAYKSLHLFIEAKTYEKGNGRVLFEGVGQSERTILPFEIADDTGNANLYAIELPSVRLASLEIAPLSTRGNFEIDRIVLSNALISYSWDEDGNCTKKIILPSGVKRGACSPGTPLVSLSEDASIHISSLPDNGCRDSLVARMFLAVVSALAVFLGGIWLIRPLGKLNWAERLQCYGVKASWLVVFSLCAYLLLLIYSYSIDIPYWDEWDYFATNSLSHKLDWRWVFSFHNEHRIVPTKIMAWFNLNVFNLNFTKQLLLNACIFGSLLFAIKKLKDVVIGEKLFPFFPAFLLFLLSPIAYENHLWAFQSQFHIVLLCSVVALIFMYCHGSSVKAIVIFSVSVIACMYSFSAGVIFAIVYLLCSAIYLTGNSSQKQYIKNSYLFNVLLSYFIIVIAIFVWFYGYAKPVNKISAAYPNDLLFWNNLFDLVSLGFGYRGNHVTMGILCLLIIVIPLTVLLLKKEARWQRTTWHVVTANLGILAVLAVISFGRANSGDPKASRYAEIGFLLIPYTSLAWWLCLKNPVFRTMALSLLWIFCFVSSLNNWSADGFRNRNHFLLYSLDCLERNSYGEIGLCRDMFPRPIKNEYERAQHLGVKFTQ